MVPEPDAAGLRPQRAVRPGRGPLHRQPLLRRRLPLRTHAAAGETETYLFIEVFIAQNIG